MWRFSGTDQKGGKLTTEAEAVHFGVVQAVLGRDLQVSISRETARKVTLTEVALVGIIHGVTCDSCGG